MFDLENFIGSLRWNNFNLLNLNNARDMNCKKSIHLE